MGIVLSKGWKLEADALHREFRVDAADQRESDLGLRHEVLDAAGCKQALGTLGQLLGDVQNLFPVDVDAKGVVDSAAEITGDVHLIVQRVGVAVAVEGEQVQGQLRPEHLAGATLFPGRAYLHARRIGVAQVGKVARDTCVELAKRKLNRHRHGVQDQVAVDLFRVGDHSDEPLRRLFADAGQQHALVAHRGQLRGRAAESKRTVRLDGLKRRQGAGAQLVRSVEQLGFVVGGARLLIATAGWRVRRTSDRQTRAHHDHHSGKPQTASIVFHDTNSVQHVTTNSLRHRPGRARCQPPGARTDSERKQYI